MSLKKKENCNNFSNVEGLVEMELQLQMKDSRGSHWLGTKMDPHPLFCDELFDEAERLTLPPLNRELHAYSKTLL